MKRRQPRSKRADTLLPYTTLCRASLQLVIRRKITHEQPRQGLEVAQGMIDHHATNAIEHNRYGIRRVRKMAAYAARRTKLRNTPARRSAQSLGRKQIGRAHV